MFLLKSTRNYCKAILFVFLSALAGNVYGGDITGTVLDAQNGESLIGVSVLVEGTGSGAATDFDGRFAIAGLQDGVHVLQVSYVGYQPYSQTVTVKSDETANVEIRLRPEDLQLAEVEVVAKANRESESMLLMEQRQMLFATQAVGAKEMSRKGLGNAERAVAQVAGVSKQDGVKNVFVRGLGDRYNATTLNGFAIPSEDPEYKNIALDIFGSSMMQHIGVLKAFRAEQGGDVAGAFIDIHTKELTGEQALSAEVEAGVNTSAAGTPFLRQQGVNYFGMSRTERPTGNEFAFANGLDPITVALPMNHDITLSGGKLLRIGNGAHRISLFAVASHTIDYASTHETVRSITANGTLYQDQEGQRHSLTTGQTVLGNAALSLGSKHEVTYTGLFIHANDQYVGDYHGLHAEKHQDSPDGLGFLRRQQSNDNRLMTHQVSTRHTLSDRWTLHTGAAYNRMWADEPDRRENYLSHQADDTYTLTGSNRQKRFFSTLRENDFQVRARARFHLDTRLKAEDSNVAFGYAGRLTDDSFEAIEYNFSAASGRYLLDNLLLDPTYNATQYANGAFTMTEGEPNTYRVSKQIHSAYAEATHRWGALSGNLGLRADFVDMAVSYHVQHTSPGTESIRRPYLLPSLNLRYDVNDYHTLRLGASRSYTLPQSKEIAPYQYVNISFTSQGNPQLHPSTNYNVDLKWDYSPTPAELVSLCAFYKHITDPIGRIDQGNSAGLLTYGNIAPYATVAGAELEVRKHLINQANTAGTRRNRLSLGINAAYIYTASQLDILNTPTRLSPLEGASPLTLGGDLGYTLTAGERNLTATVIAAWHSRRLHTIGTRSYHDIMEESTVSLDMVISAQLSERLGLKVKACNLLNPAYRLTRQVDTNGAQSTITLNEYRKGREISIGLSWEL